ncbi:MAG: hypothetical protein JW918_00405 [Anaerolineae bacterium]|nr:hypothetical protein [Anaerolineae bacterium]
MKPQRFPKYVLLSILPLIFLSSIACSGVEVGIVDTPTPTAAASEPTPHATAADEVTETAVPALPSGWTSYASENPLLVFDLAFDAERNPWAATDNGIVAWNLAGGEHTTLTTDDGLIDNQVRAISIAPDGAVWAGTDFGLARFDGETWTTYDVHSGLGDNQVTALAFAPDGTLWIGTRKNLVSYTGDRWAIHTHAAGDVAITAVAIGADGTVWATGRGCSGHSASIGGLYRLAGESLSPVTHDSPTPAAVSFAQVVVAPDGAVWATGGSGEVYRLRDGHLTTYTAEDGLVSGIVSDIAVTADGSVWVSSADNGVCRFDGTSWTTYTTADGLISNQVHSVAAASDGSVWFGAHSGLSRYAPGE